MLKIIFLIFSTFAFPMPMDSTEIIQIKPVPPVIKETDGKRERFEGPKFTSFPIYESKDVSSKPSSIVDDLS